MKNLAARHAEIAKRYERHRLGSKPSIAVLRVRDLGKILDSRYGPTIPDDDAGRDDLLIVLHHLVWLTGDSRKRILGILALRAPWMATTEANNIAQCVLAKPLKWKADVLAWRLGLTLAERRALRVTTIGACDAPKAVRAKLRKAADKERKRASRLAAGARPRSDYEGRSLAKTRPWEYLSLSERTWYRRGKPEVAEVRPQHTDSLNGADAPLPNIIGREAPRDFQKKRVAV